MSVVHEPTVAPRVARRQATAERILDTAEAILGAEGSAALTMQRLASELGYTVGATYRYYPSKEAIVAALQQRVIHGLAGDVEVALAESVVDPLVRVAVIARLYTTLAHRRPLHARMLARMIGDPEHVLDEKHAAPNTRLALDVGTAAVRELAAARAAGALSAGDDIERGLLLWASLSGVAQTRKLERWGVPGLSTDHLSEALVTTLLVGWGADRQGAEQAIARAKELVRVDTEKKR